MQELVSIIIPIYNVEKYLKRCMNSVLNQTYSNLQIILVDDGSTDGCPSICDEYAQQDERVKVIHKSNGGLSSARNAGITAVKGKYIYFLDSDDYIELNLVERCVSVIESKKCDVVVFGYKFEDDDGIVKSEVRFKEFEYVLNTKEDRIDFIVNTAIRYSKCGWSGVTRFFRADFLLENNLLYPDNNVVFAEDLAHALRVSLHFNKMVVIDDCMYHYIFRESSIMGQTKQIPYKKMIRLCADFENYAAGVGYKKEIKDNRRYIFPHILLKELSKEGRKWNDITNDLQGNLDCESREMLLKWVREALMHPMRIKKAEGAIGLLRLTQLKQSLSGKKGIYDHESKIINMAKRIYSAFRR